METTIFEKKMKKLATKDLRAKLESGKLSASESEVVTSILKKRETPSSYKDSSFEKESQDTVKKIAQEQSRTIDSQTTSIPIVKKSDKKSPKTISLRNPLSQEESDRITKIISEFSGSKKELIVSLHDQGFTKQQLDKYRPEIAHWSYIYSLYNELDK